MMIYFFVLLALMRVFKREIFGFSYLLAKKIYFLICTTKGKAISKSDFKIIKQVNEKLYELISMQRCRGYCYSICFRICKVLKKGSIEFLAVKKFSLHDKEDDDAMVRLLIHIVLINIRLRNCIKFIKLKFIRLLVMKKLVVNLMKNLKKNKSMN